MRTVLKSTVSNPGGKAPKHLQTARISKDGKWRKFPQDNHLLQYVPTGMFFGRVKVKGRIVRRKLETTVYTTAKLKLLDFLKEHTSIQKPAGVSVLTFGEAEVLYLRETEVDPTLSPKTVKYKKTNLKLIHRTWPGLKSTMLDKIDSTVALEWTATLAKEVSPEVYNHTLGVIRAVFTRGAAESKRLGAALFENPLAALRRLGVKPKQLVLPEESQFDLLVQEMADAGGRFSKDCANLVQFLAFSGCRISEARAFTWADVDRRKQELVIRSVKHQLVASRDEIRRVPILPAMKVLLDVMEAGEPHPAGSTVCKVFECQKALTRACEKIGIARITHHDLRHFFATSCIEQGADIPTLSRWMGHKDGGALAMKTYGHLRNAHSQAMASRMTFGLSAAKKRKEEESKRTQT